MQSEEAHVAPLAGAWIEISEATIRSTYTEMSLPLRERGLKCPGHGHN